jgi:phosphoribosyl-ATP pyrophosphohydrolase
MIIPSIDIRNGRAVQLRGGREQLLDGGDPLERLEEFSVAGEVAVIDLDAALGTGSNTDLIRKMARLKPIRVGGGIRSRDAAIDWLDHGAEKIIIGTAATPEFCAALPRERLVAAVDAFEGEIVTEGWTLKTGDPVLKRIERLSPYVGDFLLTQVEHEGGMAGFNLDLVKSARSAASGVRITAAGGITTREEIAALDRMGVDAQIGMALYSGALSLAQCITAPLNKPIDGRLWPTVVCDRMGTTLGLVWSTIESIEAAVSQSKGVYWSRSRDELWIKGATSGNTQALYRIDLDCDRDALKFTVDQQGSFCHTGSRSCWPSDFGLPRLESVIAKRILEGDPASGTVRLAADRDLLQAKLVEEAAELAQAQTPDEASHEGADLLYFLSVALAVKGSSIADVLRELSFRNRRISRRSMLAKREG